jgi:hypothetical protein
MATVIVASWIYASEQGWDGTWKPVAGFVWIAAIVLSVFIMRRTRCPKCGERIGYMSVSGRRQVKMMSLDYCRHCGLHLDEEIVNSNND